MKGLIEDVPIYKQASSAAKAQSPELDRDDEGHRVAGMKYILLGGIAFCLFSCAHPAERRAMETEKAIEAAYRIGKLTEKEYLELRIKLQAARIEDY